ncbi:MAG TPA: DUF5996 family protein [Kofleriaceae bacterium]
MKDLPSLPYAEWRDTRDTLHRWLQVVGKVRLGLTDLINHWWNVPLYVSPHGLTTSAIEVGDRCFEMEFDFVDSVLRIQPHDGPPRWVELAPRSVADFYAATMAALHDADIDCRIWTTPVEVADRTPFELDAQHRSYDRHYVMRFWEIVSRVAETLTKFRAGFIGKCSPVHFFWGSMDLAVTRFSGRRAPAFAGNLIDREAYSHEVSSAGWWPGDQRLERASFYSYAAPEPAGFAEATVAPRSAYYHHTLKGFYLDHDVVRRAREPEATLLDFCETTYTAAAELGNWPRADLERQMEDRHGDLLSSGDHGRRSGEDQGLRGVP